MRNVLIVAGPLVALCATDDAHHLRFDKLVTASSIDGLRFAPIPFATYARIAFATKRTPKASHTRLMVSKRGCAFGLSAL